MSCRHGTSCASSMHMRHVQHLRHHTSCLFADLQMLADNSTCTFNLHLLACQLLLQVLQRGITHEQFELWVERLIGEYKQRVKYRTRSEPEKTMMGDDMQKRALQRWLREFPDMLTWQEYSGQASSSKQRTAFCGDAGMLLGTAQEVTADVWTADLQAAVQRAIQCNVADVQVRQLWLDSWEQLRVSVFEEALLPGGLYATSTAYTRSRSRDGSFVLVNFFGRTDQLKPTVARVSRYLRLTLPHAEAQAAGADRVLLFAVCDYMPQLQPLQEEDICGLDSMILYGRDRGDETFQSTGQPVLLEHVESPLFRQPFTSPDGAQWWAFVPLRFRTGGNRG